MTESERLDLKRKRLELLQEKRFREIRNNHLRFMQHCWVKPGEPMLVGLHTRAICKRLDNAIEDFRNGKSTFLEIKVPFRHGKSDILSRYLPPRFLGLFPDCETLAVSYSASLSVKFSRFGRNLTKTAKYRELFPELELSQATSAADHWSFADHVGSVSASGLTSGLTGNGAHLLILDDYCAGREEAESQVMREKAWDAFTNDFQTRRAPVSIVIILATPWHEDDIFGRIEKSMKDDPEFPKFEKLEFPAWDEKYLEAERPIKSQYLFPERFSAEWYASQASMLGEYGTNSLLLCNPQPRKGNLLKADRVRYHESVSEFPNTAYYRIWDLAHTEKQRMKDDPDWTSGTLLAFTKVEGLWHLWIKDVFRIQAAAPQRDAEIRRITEQDGPAVKIGVETSLDSKDAYNTLKAILLGRRMVLDIHGMGDKVMRASYLEPIFESGNVHVLRAPWNLDWSNEVRSFPRGKHDDQVDNFTAGYELICKNVNAVVIGSTSGI